MPFKDPVKQKEYKSKYYLENRDKILLDRLKFYNENKERIRKRRKELHQKNKDEINAKRRERHATDEEFRKKHQEHDRKYYRNNKEKVLKSRHRYYQENQEACDKRHKDWAKCNPEKMRKHWLKVYYKRRDMGFIPLMDNPFPNGLAVDFHHPYPWFPFIVPIPRKVHLKYCMPLDKHIEYNKEWFERLYAMEIDCLLGLKPYN